MEIFPYLKELKIVKIKLWNYEMLRGEVISVNCMKLIIAIFQSKFLLLLF